MDKQLEKLLAELNTDVQIETTYNIVPTDNIPILLCTQEGLRWDVAKWWFTPSWSSDPASTKFAMFNARSENLEASKAFRSSFRYKRCVIPASSFIEWRTEGKQKTPYEILDPSNPLLLAGIYDVWGSSLISTAIITQKAAVGFASIHDRMPVFLTKRAVAKWLSLDSRVDELKAYFNGQLPFQLEVYEVTSEINNARNKIKPKRIGSMIDIGP